MIHRLNLFPDLMLLVLSLCFQTVICYWLLKDPAGRFWPRRILLAAGFLLCSVVELLAYLLTFARTWNHLPSGLATWTQAAGMMMAAILGGLFVGLGIKRNLARFNPRRRQLLRTAGVAAMAIPPVVLGFGIIDRNRFRLNEIKIRLAGLPKDLDGLRLVQITDIHLSPFLSAHQFGYAIDMANETKASLALVTGDLITRLGDPLDACLGQLARLRAEAGIVGCLGNHEVYTRTQDYVEQQGKRIGIDFLRHRARSFRFGQASLNFAGVDYQRFGTSYLVGAEDLVQPGQINVMLSHNPDVFPEAVRKGYDLTLAGHTHGGQVNVEILHHNLNIALAFTPYVRGLYRMGDAAIHVSSGIGTIGVPIRVGAPPEVTLIQLCAS